MTSFVHYILGAFTSFEQLPNELLFYLFTCMDIQHLYNAFWGLNSRLNNIFQSCQNLSLTFDDKIDSLLMKSYAPKVERLIITTTNNCDFRQFPNVNTLILCNKDPKHLKQIQPEIIPNLTHLSFILGSEFISPSQVVRAVFSNQFPSLRHVNLGCITESIAISWLTSPSLRFVSIFSARPMIVQAILASCPNLYHLQLHISGNHFDNVASSPPSNHSLQRLTLWSDEVELTFNAIDALLSYTPNVQHLYLQTEYSLTFLDLAKGIVNRLPGLSRFDCLVVEIMANGTRTGDLISIHQLYSYFDRIRCIGENENFRIFATD